jgi:hypothetical protein
MRTVGAGIAVVAGEDSGGKKVGQRACGVVRLLAVSYWRQPPGVVSLG